MQNLENFNIGQHKQSHSNAAENSTRIKKSWIEDKYFQFMRKRNLSKTHFMRNFVASEKIPLTGGEIESVTSYKYPGCEISLGP